ncbi:uncharacterized protein B0I36DRAFT_372157 [Microdochium trichocladiopsis]|uniref:Peroxin 26 n=1 Tax=Microdochium trichocladiopsis TaxID=1682393 RepID=A0A9P8YET0_9PEZI|nr:uncharacterized protein B0I36DRAFT_372157 [Microdochium trichocladiopsis]KAH7037909.1 hypothetical protein B0I36DRAFT_372157 [Microdochium trichocladiopsis]
MSTTATITAAGGGGHPGSDGTMSSQFSIRNSISSLASSRASHQPNSISRAYRQASQLFLTRRLPEALSTVLPLITPQTDVSSANGYTEPAPVAQASKSTRVKVWSLYLTILNAILELDPNEGKDAFGAQEWRSLCTKVRDGDVWEEVVQFGYHGSEGEVDCDVVINLATLLLAHARTQVLNQKRLESYLAASATPNLDIMQRLEQARSPPRMGSRTRRPSSRGGPSGADTPRDLNARVKILELYTLHVLLRNNEWDYAREFISLSTVLDEERRDAFLQALQSLQEEQQEAERLEREEKERQDEQLRKDLEMARQLRAENEERERKRLEEERSRREGSEVDYGIDQSPVINQTNTNGSANGSSSGKPRHSRKSSSVSKRPGQAAPKGKAVVNSRAVTTTNTLSARVSMFMSYLSRLMEQMGVHFRTNPVALLKLVAYIAMFATMLGNRKFRERIQRVLGTGWNKVRATAGMGVKVSYI